MSIHDNVTSLFTMKELGVKSDDIWIQREDLKALYICSECNNSNSDQLTNQATNIKQLTKLI